MRGLLLAALLVSAVLPLALMGAWSVSRSWFYPALAPSALTGDAWALVLGGSIGRSALTSAAIAIAAGVVGTAIALPIGRALAGLSGTRRHLGAALTFLPMAAPPIAFATGLQYFFLTLGLQGTAGGVLLAHLVPASSFLSLYFLGVFAVFDRRFEEEARSLGASPARVLLWITFPMLRRQIAEAVALGYLVSWVQVTLTLVIGGGVVHTLPVDVFAYVRAGQDRFAAAGALLLIVPPVLALGAARFASTRTDVTFT